MLPVKIFGLHVDPGSDTAVVLLGEVGEHDDVTRVLPIFIGPVEARAIMIGLSSTPPPRPGTHDLFAEVLRTANLQLLGVEVTGLHDGTFFADLLLNTPRGAVRVSARPSDGIALAIRCGAGIAVADEVLDDAAVQVVHEASEPFDEKEVERIVTDFQQFLATAEPSDFSEPPEQLGPEPPAEDTP